MAQTVGTSGISLKRRPLLANPSKATGSAGKMATSGSGSRRSIAGGGTCKVWTLLQVVSNCVNVFLFGKQIRNCPRPEFPTYYPNIEKTVL